MFIPTIAAIATPPGRGGVGIIRVSGKKASEVALMMLGNVPSPRYAHYTSFLSLEQTVIDQGLAIYFKAPHSFTGEDVLELHAHGGPVILDLLLKNILKLGIEMARPGEFSERAFLNGKLDLTQAEAIADMIQASSTQAALSAVRSLQGEFSRLIDALLHELILTRTYVESAIDFAEEEINFLSDGHIQSQLHALIQTLEHIQAHAKQGALLQGGLTIVIAGHPNVGKSSLLNQLSGQETAIVTDIPGTTRDVIRQDIQISGIPLHIIDTAGLRESDDPVEKEGIRRAYCEIEKADQILLLLDATSSQKMSIPELLENFLKRSFTPEKISIIHNKIDMTIEKPEMIVDKLGYTHIKLSAKTGKGIEILKNHLSTQAGLQTFTENTFSARRRHLDALAKTHQHLQSALIQLTIYQAGELVAEELKLAQNALSEITGVFLSDDLLGEIFSNFCIGK